jgi:hypothetical protein
MMNVASGLAATSASLGRRRPSATAPSDRLVQRSVLDRVLGAATIRFLDSSDARDDRRDLAFACGCSAVERLTGRFQVFPCQAHQSFGT